MLWLEKLRLILLNWNIAPLSVVGFLCWCVWTLLEFFKNTACTIDPVIAGGIFTLIGAICALLHQIYNSMQKNHKKGEDQE